MPRARDTSAVLASLRCFMKNPPSSSRTEPLKAYIIPTDDAHQSEYISDHDQRRAFVTGFTGSAGTAVVTMEHAALWTDGRYYLQAQKEIDSNWTLMRDGLKETLSRAEWLKKVLKSGSEVGVDPTLLSAAAWKALQSELEENEITLCALPENLVDLVWGTDQPDAPNEPVFKQPLEFAGRIWQEKVNDVRNKMLEQKAVAVVITALDEIAWLYNLRGNDITYNPVFLSYAIVTVNEAMLFIDDSKLSDEIKCHLQIRDIVNGVQIFPYDDVLAKITAILEDNDDKKIWVGEKSSFAIFDAVPKKRRISIATPIAMLKCVKNSVEIEGFKNSHIRDAVALCEFFEWLEAEVKKGNVTEQSASDKVLELRSQQENFISPSFETISASGPNGAIIHYRVTDESNSRLKMDKVYLCDSGAQFRDGTTDVTRTMHFATPTKDEKEAFTRVLKGHIKLASLKFPNGVKGSMLDSFARTSLWEVGLDYLHGTGHGVGSFLACHEGPCGISYKLKPDEVELEAGMILSDEPGYYEENHFGIRIESLVLVKEARLKHDFKNKGFLEFEPITLMPIQHSMINMEMLSKDEVAWLDTYHERCRAVVGEELKKQEKTSTLGWLIKNTNQLG